MKSSIFWDITPCSPVKTKDVSEKHTVSVASKAVKMEATCFFETSVVSLAGLQSVISQNIELFIVSVKRTSNPTFPQHVSSYYTIIGVRGSVVG
jgi:hypothetical protein